jgi:hypothetical protein
MVRRNLQANALQGVVGAIPGIQIRNIDGYAHLTCPFQNSPAGNISHQGDGYDDQHNQH